MWALTTDFDQDSETCEWLHPMILAAKANSEDNPGWEEAMNGPLANGYMEAAIKEIKTLQQMEVWEVVPRLQSMNVLPSTWAFKCKRYPDGKVRKLKGRFWDTPRIVVKPKCDGRQTDFSSPLSTETSNSSSTLFH
ncbi:unnamed protein product [Cylindrotheca closterium]|uniref:Uncharacterized protein n=1 Tax=Cylindrotheca closterium TaxID=2856 RepID=A0AAD2FWY8_9STRA|nr:unnamed protein product [Cylindrotheca closterium]